MIPEKLHIRTVAELERLAESYLREKLGADPALPIDIELLVEQVEGVDLDHYPKLKANHGVEGMVLRDLETGLLAIHIDADLADDESPRGRARYRMTVAEELAHIRLQRQVIDQMTSPNDFRDLHNHAQWYEVEREAKRFAAALLMPARRLLVEANETFSKVVRPLLEAGVKPTFPANERWVCSILAKRFEVSEAAMRIRLKEWPSRITTKIQQAIDDRLDYLP